MAPRRSHHPIPTHPSGLRRRCLWPIAYILGDSQRAKVRVSCVSWCLRVMFHEVESDEDGGDAGSGVLGQDGGR